MADFHGFIKLFLVYFLLNTAHHVTLIFTGFIVIFGAFLPKNSADTLLDSRYLMCELLDGNEQIGAINKILILAGECGPELSCIFLDFLPILPTRTEDSDRHDESCQQTAVN